MGEPDGARVAASERPVVPAELSGRDRSLLAVAPPHRYRSRVPGEAAVSILVVEDDAAMRDLLTEELSDAGYKDLQEIVKKAQAGDWSEAEKRAYELRESKPFFN